MRLLASFVPLISIFIALFRHQDTFGARVTIIEAGVPGYLLFVIPDNIDVTRSTYRGCRFYKNDVLLEVIKKGENKVTCQNKEICKNMKFQLNGSHAMIEVPRTSISDVGNYSVAFVFSGPNDSNFKDVQWLNITEGPLGSPTAQFTPQASTVITTDKDEPLGRPTVQFTAQASTVITTDKDEPSSLKRSSASASGITYTKLATVFMTCLCFLLMF